jgi:5-methylcytosine-specific restriction endonuclease McrA
VSASHPPKCGCKPCRDKRRRGYIRDYYRKLPPDKRATLSNKRRAKAYGVAHQEYSRSEIMRRWGYRCCYCNARAEHLDHVHPLSKGGADAEHNMVPACAPCNLSKGAKTLAAKTLAEWALTFRKDAACAEDATEHVAQGSDPIRARASEPGNQLAYPPAERKGLPWNS